MPDLMDNLALDDQEIKPIIEDSQLIGGVYYMDYDTCTIVSNDRWKDQANGVPRHCYLLATAANWENPEEFDEDDAYAMLLRSKGPAKLPAEDDLMKVREEAMRKKITGNTGLEDGVTVPGSSEDVMDVLTKNEIQFSGIEAEILGTIFQEDNEIKFGSDVETFYSSARYKVYKPGQRALERIFKELQVDDEDGGVDTDIRLGRVRYSSTERRSDLEAASVPIDIEDVIGNKTALFGMTRTGKSNTMKVLATAVFRQAVQSGDDVGQLLFDPAGEYANVNVQDEETALADIHDDAVTVYSWDSSDPEVESLRTDFFDYEQIAEVWKMVNLHLTRDADYVDRFKAANVVGPADQQENYGQYLSSIRQRSAFYACLLRAGFDPDPNWDAPVTTNQDVRDAINNNHSGQDFTPDDNDPRGGNGWIFLEPDRLEEFWQVVADNRDAINDQDDDWIDTGLEAILTVFNEESGIGTGILETLERYHDSGIEGYYPERIYESLSQGDIVIVDLTTGTDEINQKIARNIVEYTVNEQVDIFTEGRQPHDIQVYVEEAHRLFGSEYLDEAEDTDPYVRLAKEAAKYNIGLVYATQEVTGVDDSVLANTANWVVTHLNNTNETRELSKYYDFEEFERLTLEAEDVGFARVKTLSGEFIVPTQIDEFDQNLIEQAGQLYEEHVVNERED